LNPIGAPSVAPLRLADDSLSFLHVSSSEYDASYGIRKTVVARVCRWRAISLTHFSELKADPMKDHPNHDQHAGQETRTKHTENGPIWKRAHHNWIFWVALVLALAAIGTYVATLDLSTAPRVEKTLPVTNTNR
jgi:hypothetical protein